MKRIGRITTALAVTLGAVGSHHAAAQAVEPPAPAASAEVGLLIGLSSQRTLWISSTDGVFRTVADRPYLLVPRKDGFWWLGTVTRCIAEELNGEGMNITEAGGFVVSSDALFQTRVRDTVRVALEGEDCGSAEQKAHEINKKIWRATADSLAAAGDSTALHALATDTALDQDSEGLYCEIGTRSITFVTPNVISVESRHRVTEFCSPAKYYESGENRVMRFGDTTYFDLARLITKRQRQQLSRELADWLNGNELDAASNESHGLGWAVQRDSGKWTASIYIDGPIAARGGSDLEYSPTLPRSFTGDAPLPISWAKLKTMVPGLRDGAASPSGAHIVLLARDSLILAPVHGGTLGQPLIKVPVGSYESFVMLRWASPSEVRDWNRAIPTMAAPYIKVRSDFSGKQ